MSQKIKLATIWFDVNHLATYTNINRNNKKFVLTSGGFDPLHVGHIRCILDSSDLADELIVIVNHDNFLLRKKGYVFMPVAERIHILSAIKGIDHILLWDDDTQFVDKVISIIKPHFFAKGGDRSTIESIADSEVKACEAVGCKLVLGVGGADKVQSSSNLVKGATDGNFYKKNSL